ncbi:MAG: hypothetical protein OXR72_06705 [Gemmatimonadota bacterium]|nr:hypothetical protein [Gemmatimonadota bacterium]
MGFNFERTNSVMVQGAVPAIMALMRKLEPVPLAAIRFVNDRPNAATARSA